MIPNLIVQVWGFDIRLNTASVFDKNQTAMTTDQPSEALPIVHELRNPKGHGFDCMVFDGLYLFVPPPFMLKGETAEKRLQSIQEIELNDDDVIICAYPKCGTHWLWEVVEMLRSGVIEYRKEVKETQEFEIIYKEGTDALPAPRTLNTHLPLRMLPKQVVEKKVKCIKIIRNPKDVCVSFFNQYRDTVAPAGFEGDLEEFTELFLYGKICFGAYSDYLLTWKAELARSPGLPVLEMFYEEMKMAHRPLNILHDLAGRNMPDRVIALVTLFANKLSQRQIAISALGLMTITKDTILTIVGTLLTYVFIVIQFKPESTGGMGQDTNTTAG
ncbi:sulfotransferase 1A1-like isoform X3 [Haliotis rufescens]|uniref:sulfotransferase 1A1-like isoform X3 n=1 Tax=Haliotis rufescens TaxID=6454 RepID=UPI00201E9250|nr:sulfotransferase 1A1-like isoform X3 [Haliotis rufescens]